MNNNDVFWNIFKNKKVIVTGHTGFKGSWLSIWLHTLGAKVFGISNSIPTIPSNFNACKLDNKLIDYRANICNLEDIKKIGTEPSHDESREFLIGLWQELDKFGDKDSNTKIIHNKKN